MSRAEWDLVSQTTTRDARRHLAAVALCLLASCMAPVPPDKLDYVGMWQGKGMSLAINADGRIGYRTCRSWFCTVIEAESFSFTPTGLRFGFLLLRWNLRVDRPPHRLNGRWTMTIDGVDLVRLEPPRAPNWLPLIVVVVVMVAGIAVVSIILHRKEQRILAALAAQPIASLGPGASGAGGRVVPAKRLLATPASGRRCVGYDLWVTRGEEVIARTRKVLPFWLADATGRVLVEPGDHPELQALPDSGGGALSAQAFARLRELLGLPSNNPGELAFSEYLLMPGDPLVVRGRVVVEARPEGEKVAPRATPVCLVLRGTRKARMIITRFAPPAGERA